MATFSQEQLQRILDSFSVGTLRSFEDLEKDLSFKRKTKLSAKTLKSLPFLAISYASKVPYWLEKYKDADDWNFRELSKELAKQNLIWHEEDFEGLVFQIETTHNNYLLFGFNKNGNSVLQSDVLALLKKEFDTSISTFLSTDQDLQVTHKFDYHWFLIKTNQELKESEVLEKLSKLHGQNIVIEVGYGGVLFADIGDLEPRKYQPHRVKGTYRLYSDEFWELKLNDKKLADRWGKNAGLIEQLGTHSIESISFTKNAKQTHIKLSTGHELILHRKEDLRTWEIDNNKEKYSIILLGTGKFIIRDHTPWKETPIKKRKKHKSYPITKQFYKEDLPLSPDIVKKLFSQIHGSKIEGIFEYSGVSFTMDMTGGWRFSVNCNWQLIDAEGKTLVSSTTNRFTFLDSLIKLLIGVEVEEMTFSDNLGETRLLLKNGLQLVLPKEKRYHLWTMFNNIEDYHIDAQGDGTFSHIILVPDKLKDKYFYAEKGSEFANVLYALDLYRKWVQL